MDDKQHQQLNAYLDGELSPEEIERVDCWLAESAEAREELEKLKSLQQAVRSIEVSSPPVDEQWRALGLDPESAPQPSAKRVVAFPVWSGALAAIFIAAAVFWFSTKGIQSRSPIELSVAESVDLVESDFTASSPIVYLDDQSGWIVVWVDEIVDDAPFEG
ncbi:MAG: anti-sigma factor family protein [Opitutaceae bacterium]